MPIMTHFEFPYDAWLEDALRSVIRRALQHTAEHGLTGGHHFYLTFTTAAEGVELPLDLQARYPEEMTIVLQHQFWDLVVEEDHFAVTLKFRGRPSRIVIPFAAIGAFGDPSVNFGLQLKTLSPELAGDGPAAGGDTDQETTEGAESGDRGEVIALDTFRKK